MTEHHVAPDAIIGSVEGVHHSYGPGGFAIGIVPEGSSGRRVTRGELIPGPWGYLYGRPAVIDLRGGTGAEHDAAKREGRWLGSVKLGDVLVVGENPPMILSRAGTWGALDLDPVQEGDEA